MSEDQLLQGSCHCGAVRLTLPSVPDRATRCNCSLCRRIGGLWAYYEFGSVRIAGHPGNTTEYIWGDRTLSFKTRSMLNLGMLTAMSQHHELAVHVKGALRNGVTKDEIRAVLMQAAVYCGAPLALAAFRVATEAIKAYEAETSAA